jgi:hypothetical protein
MIAEQLYQLRTKYEYIKLKKYYEYETKRSRFYSKLQISICIIHIFMCLLCLINTIWLPKYCYIQIDEFTCKNIIGENIKFNPRPVIFVIVFIILSISMIVCCIITVYNNITDKTTTREEDLAIVKGKIEKLEHKLHIAIDKAL